MSRRGASGLAGILAVDKPPGMTSHDVVAAVRKSTGEGRIGHAGTLDPMATGLLVLLVGPATRLAPYLTSADKSYDARIVFGAATDTDDSDGRVVRRQSVPRDLQTERAALAPVASLAGVIEQTPPSYSALKQNGVTAHRAARAGEPLELAPREVRVFDSRLLGVEPGPPVAWNLSLRVSKGTYIRSIARDLGTALGTVAHLGGLRRTASGSLTLADAHELEDILAVGSELEHLLADPLRALGLPLLVADETITAAVDVGRAIPRPDTLDAEHSGHVAIVSDGTLWAIYETSDDQLKPAVVIPGGVPGPRGDAGERG